MWICFFALLLKPPFRKTASTAKTVSFKRTYVLKKKKTKTKKNAVCQNPDLIFRASDIRTGLHLDPEKFHNALSFPDSMDMSLGGWWTGRPGILGFMGPQRVGHDWATELKWSFPIPKTKHQLWCFLTVIDYWASLVAQTVKNLPAMQGTWVWSLGCEDSLEKGVDTHPSILAKTGLPISLKAKLSIFYSIVTTPV